MTPDSMLDVSGVFCTPATLKVVREYDSPSWGHL